MDGFKGQYEWDLAKAEANLGKHKISFETATKVFDDPNFLLIEDRIDETGEHVGIATILTMVKRKK